jgi:hypothetical protein
MDGIRVIDFTKINRKNVNTDEVIDFDYIDKKNEDSDCPCFKVYHKENSNAMQVG